MPAMEMSHRFKAYDAIITKTQGRMCSIMNIPNNYKALFLQGGATSQLPMVPLNLLQKGTADYIVTGYFVDKMHAEAKKCGEIVLVGSSKDADYFYISAQQELQLSKDADYVYLRANNVIYGTEWKHAPRTDGVSIVADMSSDILPKPVDVSKFGIAFTEVRKNMGCAGLTIVIVREDLIGYAKDFTPVTMDYAPPADKDPIYNTSPTYAIYILGLALEWTEQMGGFEVIRKRNEEGAKLLYDYPDSSTFHTATVRRGDHPLMNVTFHAPNVELDALFAKGSVVAGMSNPKGHRAAGGMRASIYNAMPLEGVQILIASMKRLEGKHK